MDDKTPAPHIRCTSKVGWGYSGFAMLIFLIQIICNIVLYRSYSQITPFVSAGVFASEDTFIYASSFVFFFIVLSLSQCFHLRLYCTNHFIQAAMEKGARHDYRGCYPAGNNPRALWDGIACISAGLLAPALCRLVAFHSVDVTYPGSKTAL
jgi:hypothetical protein